MRFGFCLTLAVSALGAGSPACAETRSDFPSHRAWLHLESIVDIGPRPPESPGSAATRAYMQETLETAGATVSVHTFAAETPDGKREMVNVQGEIAGKDQDIIIVSAHYDTKHIRAAPGFVGANDSASGVAVALALAEAFQATTPEFTLWFVFFDGEESVRTWSDTDGIYGSRAYVSHLIDRDLLPRIVAAINLDMVGDEHLRLVRESSSTRWLQDHVWTTARKLGHEKHFTERELAITDDHTPFLRARIPAVNIIDFHYGPLSRDNRWWHTESDTIGHCRQASLAVVGEVILEILSAQDTADLIRRNRN